jgi:predicted DsbA family dithiol-disulfide isomerase
MSKITIEFFHDVICSFCFPMSYRMRQLKEMMPEVEIVHRSFALVRDENDFNLMFGSREAAKAEILGHWEHANQNDDLHRFNIEGMKKTDFPFPSSMNVLIACKAAYHIAGDAGYWDVFDALQNALFVQNRNIEDIKIIKECVLRTGIDFAKWEQHFDSPIIKEEVEKDLLLAEQYGIRGVPCLIINGKHRVNGAQPLEKVIQAIKSTVGEQEAISSSDAFCRFDDGKMNCD